MFSKARMQPPSNAVAYHDPGDLRAYLCHQTRRLVAEAKRIRVTRAKHVEVVRAYAAGMDLHHHFVRPWSRQRFVSDLPPARGDNQCRLHISAARSVALDRLLSHACHCGVVELLVKR